VGLTTNSTAIPSTPSTTASVATFFVAIYPMVELTPERLAALKSAALSATPGEWHACIGSAAKSNWLDLASRSPARSPNGESCKCRMVHMEAGPPVIFALSDGDEDFTSGEGVPATQARANARYVAQASPAVMLAMGDRIAALEGMVQAFTPEMVVSMIENSTTYSDDPDDIERIAVAAEIIRSIIYARYSW